MTTLTNAEIGSVVYNLIEGVPTSISGATLAFLVNQAVNSANNFTGDNISYSSIPDSYQPAVIHLTMSNVLKLMEAQGMGTKSVSIGELSISKGMKEGTSSDFESLGYNELNELGHHLSSYQTWS